MEIVKRSVDTAALITGHCLVLLAIKHPKLKEKDIIQGIVFAQFIETLVESIDQEIATQMVQTRINVIKQTHRSN